MTKPPERRRNYTGVWLAGCLLFPCAAQAGPLGSVVGLPSQVLGGLGQSAGQIGNGLDTTLNNARRDLVGRPVTARTFDRDVNGARVLRRTVIAIAPTDGDLASAKQLNFEIVRSYQLSNLNLAVVQLRTPDGLSVADALTALRRADPDGNFDYDHIYDPSGNIGANAVARDAVPISVADPSAVRVGMIDGGIARHHAAFARANLFTQNVAGPDEGPATAHGTAIASLLVGDDTDFHGCLPGAKLYAVDVYGGQSGGGGAIEIARALDWLAANKVAVVNISLAGPANSLLELSIERFLARGGTVVAAVGNNGPAAPHNFPASYPGVVAVTSVDARRHLQIDANRGNVTFAALGVDVRAAKLDHGYTTYTGTSFAAPVVAARFALLVLAPEPRAAKQALETLITAAIPIDGDRSAIGNGYLAPPRGSSLLETR